MSTGVSPLSSTKLSGRANPMSRTDLASLSSTAETPPSEEELKTREVFQQFVAGTFFQEMFKALRKTQGKAHYFHGGQAEEIFQAQFDQTVSEDLAKRHGAAMTDSLYQPFRENLRARQKNAGGGAGEMLNRLV